MKKLLVVVFIALATPCLAFGQTQTPQPPKPGPEVQRLGYFVGTWKFEGEFLTDPKGKYGGTTVCEWFAGGLSVVCRPEGSGVRGPMNELHIYSYSTAEKAYTWYSISRTGAARVVRKMSVEGKIWTSELETTVEGKPAKYRYTWVETSPSSFSYKYERSVDGGPWTQMVDLKCAKVK